MTLSEFAHISNKKEKTIRKNKAKIPGVKEVDGELIFPAGTRYPYNLRGTRLDSTEKRIVTLLKATSREEYIDHTMLRMEKVRFDSMTDELLREEYLIKNGTNNPYGANQYDVTRKYTDNKDVIEKKNSSITAKISANFGVITISMEVSKNI